MTLAEALSNLCNVFEALPATHITQDMRTAVAQAKRALAKHRKQEKDRISSLKGRAGRKGIPEARRREIGTAEGSIAEVALAYEVGKSTVIACRKEFRT